MDHYRIPSSARQAHGGVNRKRDVKYNLKSRACEQTERERERRREERKGGRGWVKKSFAVHL